MTRTRLSSFHEAKPFIWDPFLLSSVTRMHFMHAVDATMIVRFIFPRGVPISAMVIMNYGKGE